MNTPKVYTNSDEAFFLERERVRDRERQPNF